MALSGVLASVLAILQLNGVLLMKLLQQQKRLQQLYHIALVSRNLALSRYQRIEKRYLRRKRSIWVKPGRTDQWWRNLKSDKMSSDEWENNLHISKEDFRVLLKMIRPFAVTRSSKVRRDVLSLEKRVAVTIHYLKDQGSMKMTANAFGIARCIVGQIIQEICMILTKDIGPELIKFSETKEEVSTEISAFLQRFGFPQVIGCIDGTHIPIKQPVENAHDYFSYKQTYSINCQAICNAFGQFTNVEVKWPGSLHDARAFSNCDVQKRFSDRKLDLFYKELLPGEECVP